MQARRDRTGMMAMLLLAAVQTETDEIVDDYLETVGLGDLRVATANRNNAEAEIEPLRRAHGTTTERAFQTALDGPDIDKILCARGPRDSRALQIWRGVIPKPL